MNEKRYIVVTDYVQADTGLDVSDAIQRIINENPHRTIYFPDGEYVLAKPICTSAKPENAVHLELSRFATLKASDDWADSEAMIRLGGAEPFNTIYVNGSNYGIIGGIIDGNMKANGISIDSGRETVIRDLSIKHTQIGIYIKKGANGGSSDADIDMVHIVGNNKKDSIGVLIEGADNSLTNMRIAAVQTGIMLRRCGNFLRNIHPLHIFGYEYGGVDDIEYEDTVAFWDQTDGKNWYNNCYSDQLATAFRIRGGSTGIFDCCFAMWYSPRGDKEIGFACDGRFCASILNADINFLGNVSNCKFITVAEEGGCGIIENPIFNTYLNHDDTYKAYLVGRVIN
jgi:hypothetical protein